MRATIFKRENAPGFGANEDERLAGKTCGERLPSFNVAGPGDRIPMVGMRANFAKIEIGNS